MLQQELEKQETKKTEVERLNRRYITPAVNIYESAEETKIVFDMPGVDEKSVDISYDKEVLVVEGRSSYSVPDGFEGSYIGFKTGDYLRKFNVNKPIDLDKSKAVMKNGRLTLQLAKIKPNTTKIEVKAE
jgi:HSP20 family protein